MKQPQSDHGRHLLGIDLVRFAAALLVAFFHFTWQEPATATTAWFGWIGVQIFFVISGVVIARSANDTTPLRFLRARLLRLYPCAWICGVIGVFVLSISNRAEPNLIGRFVASFLLSPVGPFLVSAYWTLPIELAFYALILVVLLRGDFAAVQTVAIGLCLASAGYIVAYALQQAGAFASPDLEFGYDWKNLSLLRHGIYFGLGMMIWLWSERRLSQLGWTAAAVATVAAGIEITCRTAEIVKLLPAAPPSVAAWSAPIVIWLGFVAIIVWSARWEALLPLPSAGVLIAGRAAGLATFPLYLLHEQFGLAVRNILVRLHIPLLAAVCVAIAATTALAFAVARWAEPVVRDAMRAGLDRLERGPSQRVWLRSFYRPGGTV